MRNLWIPVAAFVLVGGLAWWLTSSDPVESGTGNGIEAHGGDVRRPPVLVGTPREAMPPMALPSLHTSHEGACRVTGLVRRDEQPARAHVELCRGWGLRPRSQERLSLPFPAGEVLAEADAGEDGTFLFSGLAPGAYVVIARAQDGATAWRPYIVRPTRLQVSSWLDLVVGANVLEGEAVWADGRPFRGFVCPRAEGDRLPHVPTDAHGSFRIPGLPWGSVALTFVEPDRFASTVGVTMPVSGPVRIVVDEGLETRSGLVVAADDGLPVAGAVVTYVSGLRDSHRLLTARTVSSADGSFSYRLLREIGGFEVTAPGFAPAEATSKVGEALVIRLVRRARIVGRVVEQGTGRPVGGVPIHASFYSPRDLPNPLARSAADGTFTAEVGPGEGRLWAFGGGYLSADITRMTAGALDPLIVQTEAGEVIEHTIEVVPAARAVGRVLDTEGEPISNLLVVLAHPERWRGFKVARKHENQASAVTDAQGRFSFETLVPGFPVFFETKVVTGLPGEVGPITPAPGETVDATILMPEACWLPVRVVDRATGRGIEAALVQGRQPERYRVTAETGADGRGELGPLRPGEATVGVHHRDYRGFGVGRGATGGRRIADVRSHSDELFLELERAAYIQGRIVDPPDVWLLEIGVFPVGAPADRGRGVAGPARLNSGRFRFGPLSPGPYDVVLLRDESDSTRRQIGRWTVEAGGEELELELADSSPEAADALLIDVSTLDGRAVHGWIRLLGPRRIHVHTDSFRAGRYEVAGVSWGGPVWIEIAEPTSKEGEAFGAVRHGPIPLAPGRVQIVVPPPRVLGGRVLREDGSPVAGLLVRASRVRSPGAAPFLPSRARARTDPQGRFHIGGLGAGPHRLSFSTPPTLGLVELPVVEADRTDVEIRLAAGLGVPVRVADDAGRPLGGARVRAALPDRPDAFRSAETDAAGVATLTGLSSATSYDLDVVPPPDREDLLDAWQGAWRPEATRMRLGAGELVSGVVRQNGTPLGGATVWWKDGRGRWRRVLTRQTGAFRFTAVPGAKVLLCADPPHTVRRDTEAEPTEVAPGTTNVVLDL